jgi:hypothetical protein
LLIFPQQQINTQTHRREKAGTDIDHAMLFICTAPLLPLV